MTTAPDNLLAVRDLLLEYLDIAPGSPSSDLTPAEVGIVGDPEHRGGYHCGSDRVTWDDYSVDESPRDRSGLTLYASALDTGWFEVRSRGALHNLRTFSAWCVAQCAANTADSRDLREIIYSADGRTVRRWDRLGRRSTGDSSHLWHTHFSFFRDATKAGRDQRPLFRRYLTEIGLLASEDEDMTPEQDRRLTAIDTRLFALFRGDTSVTLKDVATGNNVVEQITPNIRLTAIEQALKAIPGLTAQVAALSGKDFTDENAIVAGVLAVLTPAAIAAAIPPTLARQVADELAARLAE
ncbi:hypothetical protein AB0J86_34355 [Micromonospora sp. NPDC049559]|uniref:hypothetical protein n=1 Tax=Micromonospora sp. NPDC049559 TaxID=3155923 RepID=UPI0034219391